MFCRRTANMVVTVKGIVELEGECQDKPGENSLDARDGGKKNGWG